MQLFQTDFAYAASLLLAPSVACSPRDVATNLVAALEISVPEAHRMVQAGKLTLIDISRPEEWRQTGVEQGAARIKLLHPGGVQGFVNAVLEQVDGNLDAPIGIICRTGNRTSQIQPLLQAGCFTQIYRIKEGMGGSADGPGRIGQG